MTSEGRSLKQTLVYLKTQYLGLKAAEPIVRQLNDVLDVPRYRRMNFDDAVHAVPDLARKSIPVAVEEFDSNVMDHLNQILKVHNLSTWNLPLSSESQANKLMLQRKYRMIQP